MILNENDVLGVEIWGVSLIVVLKLSRNAKKLNG